ncbi:hypothetical protein [Litoribacter populi]|uniref:hypothetical protein n=1 Tax=Litoribacter populi TaxID=2598460 RepID=UPI001180AB93|nr:hypothetical protein [Litoribacter populi]
MMVLILGLSFLYSCSNILEFESIDPCINDPEKVVVRTWSSVDGLVRYDQERMEYFIVARFPEADNLTVLRTCNIPSEFASDQAEIRFFGNEYSPLVEETVIEDNREAKVVPFEITYIERVVKK